MSFSSILEQYWQNEGGSSFLVAAIHAGKDRRMEYGTFDEPDYLGRGAKAGDYCTFITSELLPRIQKAFKQTKDAPVSFAGFSLGGLSAFDLVWSHPGIFQSAGVFSGSFWWRSLDQTDPQYSDSKHRIMHQRVQQAKYDGTQRFFFQCGALDEQSDRNRNGVIDSIDDTLDLIEALTKKGVSRTTHIYYLELADGKHDVQSWGRAFPFFLQWNYG
jgi:enterochelin esterase-like enzyme